MRIFPHEAIYDVLPDKPHNMSIAFCYILSRPKNLWNFISVSRMVFLVGFLQVFGDQVRVDFGGFQFDVAQDALDDAQAGAGSQHVRREGVAECVAGERHTGINSFSHFAQELDEEILCQTVPSSRHKKGTPSRIFPPAFVPPIGFEPHLFQIPFHPFTRRFPHGDHAILFPFAPPDHQRSFRQVQIVHVEVDQLASSDAR